jgi:hypothetical protein
MVGLSNLEGEMTKSTSPHFNFEDATYDLETLAERIRKEYRDSRPRLDEVKAMHSETLPDHVNLRVKLEADEAYYAFRKDELNSRMHLGCKKCENRRDVVDTVYSTNTGRKTLRVYSKCELGKCPLYPIAEVPNFNMSVGTAADTTLRIQPVPYADFRVHNMGTDELLSEIMGIGDIWRREERKKEEQRLREEMEREEKRIQQEREELEFLATADIRGEW